ncbi:MAG: HAMP domain-containing histidine kinase [Alphaproteobacteria bacterium]|nr:HAMP domain-containing histidine kinase [Alphaproteobacteria bacterium]
MTPPTPPLIRDRALKPLVELVLGSLPLTMVLNPIWAALSIIPLGGGFPSFGIVPFEILIAVVALHVLNSCVAGCVYLWAARARPTPEAIFRVLLILQLWLSVSWGAGALACWEDGNTTNNTFLALLVIGMTWALAITRSVHPVLFALGVMPMMTMFWLRATFAPGEAAGVFMIFAPVFAAYAWFLGTSARDRVSQMLAARFELEDMATALEAARSDAVTKTIEAEAASASKSAFVANMSHELRTPLNAILGFAELIQSAGVGGDVPTQYRAYAGDIRESGAHLLSLINDMLDIAKIEAGKMEIDRQVLDASASIEGAVRFIAHRADDKRQSIEVRIDPHVRLVADERAFKQVLLNLLSNAVKFSPPGGKIMISCARQLEGGTCLTVSDDGPGIPLDKIKQLFRPFSRVDNRYDRDTNGTGLGLALVRGLVALHGGKVWLENRPTGGLVAGVEFPGPSETAQAA